MCAYASHPGEESRARHRHESRPAAFAAALYRLRSKRTKQAFEAAAFASYRVMGVAASMPERGASPALDLGAAGRNRLSGEGALQPDATADQGTDLQQLQADGAADCVGKRGVTERGPTAQLFAQHVSHRSETTAELVGRRGRR